MGGHQSTQTAKTSTAILTNAVFTQTQNCMSMVDGTNFIGVYGSGNVLNHVFQNLSISLSKKCVNKVTNKENFQNNVTNEIVQNLKDQEVALTEWMDSSGDDQETDISNSVTTNITTKVAEDCLDAVSGMNVLVVEGSGNVVEYATQKQTEQVVSECLQSAHQSLQARNGISNTVNQYSDYTSKNPLAFITDAIEATLKSLVSVGVILFVTLVILALVFEMVKRGHIKRGAGVALAALQARPLRTALPQTAPPGPAAAAVLIPQAVPPQVLQPGLRALPASPAVPLQTVSEVALQSLPASPAPMAPPTAPGVPPQSVPAQSMPPQSVPLQMPPGQIPAVTAGPPEAALP